MRCTKCEHSAPSRELSATVLLVGVLLTVALGATACAPAPLSAAALSSDRSSIASTPTLSTTTPSSGTTGATNATSAPPAPSSTTEPTTPDPSVTTLPSSGGATTPTTGAAPRSPSTPAPTGTSSATVVDAVGHVETAFATAAGGIVCAVSAEGPQARCDLESSTWTPPPTPVDCHGAWGAGISLTARGAELTCTTDTVLADAVSGGAGTWWERLPAARLVSRASGQQEVTLAAGAVVVAGSGSSRLACRSDGTTVTCTLGSGRFSVSRQAYTLR